ncbi:MAG TPA: two-component regulator propeller domain-containing protein [Flavobacteriales bacterium]|nr:two-component regulator propeller domain-containing protein [Flavobacteriales bacterium]
MKTYLYPPTFLLLFSCNTSPSSAPEQLVATHQSVSQETPDTTLLQGQPVTQLSNNIESMFQDSKGNYWFGTQKHWLYKYDGKNLVQFTQQHGLDCYQIQNIQEDAQGNIWLTTDGYKIIRFDGKKFTAFNVTDSTITNHVWNTEPNDLWFYGGGGPYRYANNTFSQLFLSPNEQDQTYAQQNPNKLSPYAVYSILKDKKGNLWFGTQSTGVCKYDPHWNDEIGGGKSFTWFDQPILKGPAVLALFEDKNGNMWFGNNGGGLFVYDGKTVRNFTEEKGLSNREFRKSGKEGPGTLARIFCINQDNDGNMWIGTVDAGVWKFDGKNLTNYTIKHGLPNNTVNKILKDGNSKLWFATRSDGVYTFDGNTFKKFEAATL